MVVYYVSHPRLTAFVWPIFSILISPLVRLRSKRYRTKSQPFMVKCFHGSLCASCSPMIRAPARRLWQGCSSRSC